jgi:hypothetical protein
MEKSDSSLVFGYKVRSGQTLILRDKDGIERHFLLTYRTNVESGEGYREFRDSEGQPIHLRNNYAYHVIAPPPPLTAQEKLDRLLKVAKQWGFLHEVLAEIGEA